MRPGEYFDSICKILEDIGVSQTNISRLSYQYHPATSHGVIGYVEVETDKECEIDGLGLDVHEFNIPVAVFNIAKWMKDHNYHHGVVDFDLISKYWDEAD